MRSQIRRVTWGALLLCFFALAFASQLSTHAYRSDFGGSPDEPAHFVTGLMVRDYLGGLFPGAPMRYAENYYVHYPKVAFGHWPPVFYFIQAAWMLVFPASHASALVLMALLTAVLCAVLALSAREHFGMPAGIAVGVLLLALPIVQFHGSMVMAEVPLALFTLLATLRYAAFLRDHRWQDSMWFGIWTSLAVLTKGSGYALALMPAAALLTGQIRLIKRWSFWLPAVVVAVATLPYTILTLRMNSAGWDSRQAFDPAFTAEAIRRMGGYVVGIMGIPLFLFGLAGLVWLIRSRAARTDSFWACLLTLACSVYLFHVILPVAIEPRYHFMALPAFVLFAAAGAQWMAGLLPRRVSKRWAVAAALLLLAIGPSLRAMATVRRTNHGFRDVARFVAASPELRQQMILVSTSGRTAVSKTSDERGDPEGMFIAEMASLDSARPSGYVLRASKMLSRADWNEKEYKLLYDTPEAVGGALDKLSVSLLVVHTAQADSRRPKHHHDVLLEMLKNRPNNWREVYHVGARQTDDGLPEEISVYSFNGPLRTRGSIGVDLTNKLNRVVHDAYETADEQPKRGIR
jgi:hypothetical protein